MKAVVNVCSGWGIGCNGKLLCSIPEDMRFFRSVTYGKIVIMGRKTLESLPGGRPLKGRINIVISSDPESIACGDFGGTTVLFAAAGRKEALEAAAEYMDRFSLTADDICIIGGESIYRMFLDDCDTCLVTSCDACMRADRFFPDLSAEPGWELAEKGDTREYQGIHYSFDTWKRKL